MNTQYLLREKFKRNRVAMQIVSIVICIEQFLYALLISYPGSALQKIHYWSAVIMLILFVASLCLKKLESKQASVLKSVFEILSPLAGMSLALIRILYHEGSLLSIPTVYLAVIYGGSVVFLYTYVQSAFLYGVLTFLAVFLVPRFQLIDPASPLIADLIINGLIAWIVAALNYKSFMLLEEKTQLIEEQNKRLLVLSERDWLTGLFNRRKIEEAIHTLQNDVSPDKQADFSIILFDLDLFKEINDTYGHQIGDQVLQEIASLLQQQLKEDELCGRWGGEEFLIITNREGKRFAESFRMLLDETVFAGIVHSTASFGVAECSLHANTDELIRVVDQRLYKAKNLGRNQVVSA